MLVAGAGMAGLVCAARARELGLRPRLIEKGTRAGGSMLLSSCVIWRHLDFDEFRAECSGGDEALQRLIWERLDDALAWLVSLGAQPVWEDTENPRTTGKRFDPRALTQLSGAGRRARDAAAGRRRRADSCSRPAVGERSSPKKTACCCARTSGATAPGSRTRRRGMRTSAAANGDEFYGRAMPAPPARVREEDFVSLSQLYGTWARVYTEEGHDITPSSVAWHENDLAQRIGPRAWFVLDDAGLAHARERVDAARAAGGTVIEPAGLPFDTPPGSRIAVHVAGAVTHTISGLRIDTRARVLDQEGVPIDGLHAAGVDAGGVAAGGYASGLAQALVLGLTAAEALAR